MEPGNENAMPPHHTILSLSTEASTFFGDLTVPFADGLNTAIGGRGSGKTSLLYLLRFALGTPIPASYAEAFDTQVSDNLGPGTVTVRVRTRHGVEYAISRSYGDAAPKVVNAAGERVDVSLDGELFRLDAYAAKEIEGIGDDPVAQLALLDRFAPSEMRRFAQAEEDVLRRIAQSGGEIDRLRGEIEADLGREAELPTVLEALKGMTLGDPLAGDELAKAEARRPARGREQNAMKGLAGEVAHAQRAFDQLAQDVQRRLAAATVADLEGAEDPIGPIFRRTHQAVARATEAASALAVRFRAELAQAAEAVAAEGRALLQLHDREDETYRALVVRKDSDRARAMEREALHRRRDALEALAGRLAERRRERGQKMSAHDALHAEREAILAERSALRSALAASIETATSGAVRVTVQPGKNSTSYCKFLTDILGGSGTLKELVAVICARIPPAELYAAAVADDLAPVVEVDKWGGNKEARAQKALAWLRASGQLRAVEIAKVDDLAQIELRIDKEYFPAARVSTGQRCTAILPILLLPSESPLLIDQVEDHTDNRFVCEVLVRSLVAARGGRQFLFVTHNPNLTVLADAERVMELAARDGRGDVVAAGTVDEMRERIEAVLEGGREAFVRRGERYGHLPERAAEGAKGEPK
ncbi:MAG TPA: ATP-binding protein [Polyangiaceae bacterium]|jgi:hypothetical protein